MTYGVLDLFCGAGGFSEGFRQAGFDIQCGIDVDKEALITYSRNFPEALALNRDLSLSIGNFHHGIEEIRSLKPKVIIGGPPCQGFSVAGKRLEEDPRNALYKAYLNIIRSVEPEVIVIENVISILSLYDGRIAREIIEDLGALGYITNVMRLNAVDYGVPQNRKRVFFVAMRGRVCRPPDKTTFGTPITSEMAISDLPLLEGDLGEDPAPYPGPPKNDYQRRMRAGSACIYNHVAVDHKPETRRIISLVPDGGNYKCLPETLRSTRKVNIAWTRLDSSKPSFTIDAGHNHHFHYSANRVPTVRESARLQSFPDRFRFFGKRTNQFRQVGNAVPPLLARALAERIREEFDHGL